MSYDPTIDDPINGNGDESDVCRHCGLIDWRCELDGCGAEGQPHAPTEDPAAEWTEEPTRKVPHKTDAELLEEVAS